MLAFSYSYVAATDFSISTTINSNTFYTLPILTPPILEYYFNSEFNLAAIDSNVSVYIIAADTDVDWWNETFAYRIPIAQSVSYHPDKTSTLILDTRTLISESMLKQDCTDLRIYNSETEQIPFILEDCNTEDTRIRFKKKNPVNSQIYFYLGNSGITSLLPEKLAYKFFEEFINLTSFNESWLLRAGNYSIDNHNFVSDSANVTEIKLNSSKISLDSELKYSFSSSQSSSHTLILSEFDDFSVKSFSLTIEGDNVESCWTLNNVIDCSTYAFSEKATNDVYVELFDDFLNIYINGEKINPLPQYYGIENSGIYFVFSNQTTLSEFSLLERTVDEFSLENFQKLMYYISGTAFGGSFGFNYDVSGFPEGLYSVVTKATRPDMNTQYSVDRFSTHYNKISFDVDEEGLVSVFSNRYLVDTRGTMKITNDNPESVNVDIEFDTPLLIQQISGNYLKNNKLDITISPFSSREINYFVSGVTSQNPIDRNYGAAANLLKDVINQDNQRIRSSSFRYVEIEDEEIIYEGDEFVPDRKQLRYTVDGRYILDSFSRLYLTKYFSNWKVAPGDVVEVILRITNMDPFSREVVVRDSIPSEFEYFGVQRGGEEKLSWDFIMNKETARILSYKMVYVGNSTGKLSVMPANATSERLLVYSNIPYFVRTSDEPKSVFVTKKVESWPGTHLYDAVDSARVTISVVNTGNKPIEEIYVDDLWKENALFVNPSVATIFNARWLIDNLDPGSKWTVSYMTEMYDELSNLPKVRSYTENIDVSGDLIDDDFEEVGIWKSSFWKTPFALIVLIFVLVDLVIIGYYLYRNPFFESEEEITPSIYMNKIMELIPAFTQNFIGRFVTKFKQNFVSSYTAVKRLFSKLKDKSKDGLAIFSKKSSEYYKERNISLVEENVRGSLSAVKKEITELKKLTFNDWIKLFIHYKRSFFKAIHNKITYSMFVLSGNMLIRNPDSKMGKILGFSAKVINPELKSHLVEVAEKKIKKKQSRYENEIARIERLREKNEKLLKESNPFLKLFLRIKFLFKK